MAHLQTKNKLSATRAAARVKNPGDGWLPLVAADGEDSLSRRAEDAARIVCVGDFAHLSGDCFSHIIAEAIRRVGITVDAPSAPVQTLSNLSPYRRAVLAEQAAHLHRTIDARADDERLTFTALRNIGRNFLRSHIARAERERAEDAENMPSRAAARTVDVVERIIRDYADDRAAGTRRPEDAERIADRLAHALASAPDSILDGARYLHVWRWLYVTARGAGVEVAAPEMGTRRATVDMSCSRARAIVRERYPMAHDFVRGLDAVLPMPDETGEAGKPTKHATAWAARGDAPVLRVSRVRSDGPPELRCIGRLPREVERPESKDAARERCDLLTGARAEAVARALTRRARAWRGYAERDASTVEAIPTGTPAPPAPNRTPREIDRTTPDGYWHDADNLARHAANLARSDKERTARLDAGKGREEDRPLAIVTADGPMLYGPANLAHASYAAPGPRRLRRLGPVEAAHGRTHDSYAAAR